MTNNFKDQFLNLYQAASPIICQSKINLRLKIEGLRNDNYHLISSLIAPTDLSDRMYIHLTDQGPVQIEVRAEAMGELIPNDIRQELGQKLSNSSLNLAARAAEKFIAEFKLPCSCYIALHKHIPVGAGLGGGSSNAGAILNWMRIQFLTFIQTNLGLSSAEIDSRISLIAQSLGADVTYALYSKFARVSGVGENVQFLMDKVLLNHPSLLLLPKIEVSTKAVYDISRSLIASHNISYSKDEALDSWVSRFNDALSMYDDINSYQFLPGDLNKIYGGELKSLIVNDLEVAVCKHSPQIGSILEKVRSVPDALVSISGSGGAMFVLSKFKNYIHKDLSDQIHSVLSGLEVSIRPTIINPVQVFI